MRTIKDEIKVLRNCAKRADEAARGLLGSDARMYYRHHAEAVAHKEKYTEIANKFESCVSMIEELLVPISGYAEEKRCVNCKFAHGRCKKNCEYLRMTDLVQRAKELVG